MNPMRFSCFLIQAILAVVLSGSANEPRNDVLIVDFEGTSYGEWETEGTAFGTGPAQGTFPYQMKVSGYLGKGLVNSFLGGDQAQGILTSPPFKIERNFINFLIGGGGYAGETCINLLVDSKVVRTATGTNTQSGGSEALSWQNWNVEALVGQIAQIQIVDQRSGGWGHINVDQIFQSDHPEAVVFSKELLINGKYLLVPVKNDSDTRKSGEIIRIEKCGKILREFRVKFPENDQAVDWTAFYPVDRFAGEIVTITSSTGQFPTKYTNAVGQIKASDTIPEEDSDYVLPYRNQFHFSVRRGWNNDVNGLVYNNGTYHLYYQYNPFNTSWDNMHWGYATSTDLVHWTERDIALFQNHMTDQMYSGGGFMDPWDSADVALNGAVPQYAVFTSTGRGECLAYSLDGGSSFTELPENPVLKHNGRDPKVIWHKPTQKWIMAVFEITDEILEPLPVDSTPDRWLRDSVAFYSSKNLKEWTFESRFIHSDRSAIHECPELFEIAVEGHPDETRWILYGVENRYFIGQFDGHEFVMESGPFSGEIGIARAAQMVSDAPDGRKIQIAWARQGFYPNRWPNQRFSQGFMLPKEVVLRETPDGLRLYFYPVKEVDSLRGRLLGSLKNPSVEDAEKLLNSGEGKLLDVFVEYELGDAAGMEITVNGQLISVKESGSLRILSDRTITEVFVNEGKQVFGFRREEGTFDDTTCEVMLSGVGTITKLVVFEMRSVWSVSQ